MPLRRSSPAQNGHVVIEQRVALELRSVSKTYSDGEVNVDAVVDIDLSVRPGELVLVIGPSGSGKSTLLTIAGGLETPTQGQVFVNGQELTGLNTDQRAAIRRDHVGYVFQELNLLGALTARENVTLPLELSSVPRAEAGRLADEALAAVGLNDKTASFPDELSGGQRQRVAIARALVGDRRLLLADEPTGSLDSANGAEVLGLIRGLCDRGGASVVVTHDPELRRFADRVVALADGRVTEVWTS